MKGGTAAVATTAVDYCFPLLLNNLLPVGEVEGTRHRHHRVVVVVVVVSLWPITFHLCVSISFTWLNFMKLFLLFLCYVLFLRHVPLGII